VLFIHGVLRTEINLPPDHFSTFNFIPSTLLTISQNSSTNLPLCSLYYALAAKEVLYLTGGSILHIFLLGEEKRGVQPCRRGTFSLLYRTPQSRARIFKLLRSPKIDSEEPIPPGCLAWRASKKTVFLHGS